MVMPQDGPLAAQGPLARTEMPQDGPLAAQEPLARTEMTARRVRERVAISGPTRDSASAERQVENCTASGAIAEALIRR